METGAATARGARTRALYEQLLAPVARRVDGKLADEAHNLPAELREMYDYAVGGGMRFRPCLMYLAYLVCSAGIDGEGGRGVGGGERDGVGGEVDFDGAFDAADGGETAVAEDVGGLRRPRRNGADTRCDQEQLAARLAPPCIRCTLLKQRRQLPAVFIAE